MEGPDTIKFNAYFASDGTDWWATEMKHDRVRRSNDTCVDGASAA